ncbi:MAG: right-handed parallel beta-helix repeat-containing protein [Myxococcaceae bacterium]|nr:right-handed parallel beta-helix repeat-containing protein [Myxococcaceae bacterium]
MPIDAPMAAGLTCDRIVVPPVSLEESLRTANAGDCIILASGTYSGSFVVPSNVSLAASEGAMVTLTGGDPVLTVKGGKRSVVRGVRVVGGSGLGIAIDPGPAQLISVAVTQMQRSALSISCAEADCGEREVVLTDVELTEAPTGLRVDGAVVRMERGRVSAMRGTSLSSGSGVVATKGAVLALDGVAIEQNENVGVLLDGAATRATVQGCTLAENQGRGLWAQGQAGPGATVTVTGGEVRANGLVGIGVRDTEGLVVRDTRVVATKAVRVAIDFNRFDQVGDGIGLFSGTRAATLEGVVVADNARAQVLADAAGRDVSVRGTFSGGRFRVVVQNATAAVTADPMALDQPAEPLVVRAAEVGLSP